LGIRLSIFILTEQDRMNVSSVCVGLPPLLTLNEQDTLNVYLLGIRLSIFILNEQDTLNMYLLCIHVSASIRDVPIPILGVELVEIGMS
jgi:hypothetical protein